MNWNLQIALASQNPFRTANNYQPTTTALTTGYTLRCREITFESEDTLKKCSFFVQHIPRADGLQYLKNEISPNIPSDIPFQVSNEYLSTTNATGRRVFAKHTVVTCEPKHTHTLSTILERMYNSNFHKFISQQTWTDHTTIAKQEEIEKQHYLFVRKYTSNFLETYNDIDVI
jgi:hypothetical protein